MDADTAYVLIERIETVLEAELERLAHDGHGSKEIEHLIKGCKEMLVWLEKF